MQYLWNLVWLGSNYRLRVTFFISGCLIEDRRIRNIYNPKHYIAENLPERRPLESFHKVIVPDGWLLALSHSTKNTTS